MRVVIGWGWWIVGNLCRLCEIVIRDIILLLAGKRRFFSDFGPIFGMFLSWPDMDPFATFVLVPHLCPIIPWVLVTIVDPLTPSFPSFILVSRALSLFISIP